MAELYQTAGSLVSALPRGVMLTGNGSLLNSACRDLRAGNRYRLLDVVKSQTHSDHSAGITRRVLLGEY